MNTNPADIILLHIGTNDISGTQAINSIVTEVSQILDKIDQYEAQKGITAWVILARIVNRSDPQSSDGLDTTLFNNQLHTMANNRISSGDKIIVVDMESALNYPGDLSDDKHPNAGGYSKMADVWYNALVNLINLPQSVTNPGDQNAVEGAAFSLDINATDPENDALTYSAINLPAWLSINPSTALISGVLPNDTASGGPYTITVRATDPDGFPDVRSYNSDDEVFTLTVTNPAPQVTNPGNQNDDEGETVTLGRDEKRKIVNAAATILQSFDRVPLGTETDMTARYNRDSFMSWHDRATGADANLRDALLSKIEGFYGKTRYDEWAMGRQYFVAATKPDRKEYFTRLAAYIEKIKQQPARVAPPGMGPLSAMGKPEE